MKATGIVRRIDDLGRVVIPKEIRRTMRIREGDPLEIYTDADGEVIFKKYSPIGELSPFATQYAEVLSRNTGLAVLVSDRDHIVAVSGISKKEFLERRISPELEDLMENRRAYMMKASDIKQVVPVEGIDKGAGVVVPILAAGDVTGSVILLLSENNTIPSESDLKLVQVASAFLGRQMEE